MVFPPIWVISGGQDRVPYIRNALYFTRALILEYLVMSRGQQYLFPTPVSVHTFTFQSQPGCLRNHRTTATATSSLVPGAGRHDPVHPLLEVRDGRGGVAPGGRDGEDAVLAVVARHPLGLDARWQRELLLEQLRPRAALLLDLLKGGRRFNRKTISFMY